MSALSIGAQSPTAVTLALSGQSNTVATLNGTANPTGLATTAWFEWDLAANSYTNATANSSIGSGASAVAVSQALSGLTPGLLYHGRVVGSNSTGVTYGRDVVFGSPALKLPGPAETNVIAGRSFSDPGVITSGDVQAATGGASHSLALKIDGTVVGWGYNSDGQATVPVGLSNVVAVSPGGYHSVVLKDDGTVVAWGDNLSVQALPLNAAPSTISPNSISVTEDVAAALTGISFSDADAGSGSLTATFAVGTGSLTATSGGGVTVGGSGSSALTLDGALADLNSFVAASNVVFLTATNAYTNVFLAVMINDNGNTGGGGAQSATNTVILTVTPVTDFPDIALSSGSAIFIESENAPPIPRPVDENLIVTDPDGPSITAAFVAISQQFVASEDVLGFTNIAGTMGNIAGSYDTNGGYVQLISAGGTATLAEWQTALRSLTYENISESPNTATRTVEFRVYAGGVSSLSRTRTVTVTAVNDPPQLLNLHDDSVTFTENGPAVALDALGDALVTEADFTSFNGGYLLATISTNLVSAQDVLGINTNGIVALSAGMTLTSLVSVNGTNIGTIASAGSAGEDLIIHWNTAATTNLIQALIRALVYTNVNDTPTTNARTAGVTLEDGLGASTIAVISITVISSDDVPTVTMSGGAATFVEGADVASTPVVVDGGIVVADPDDAELVSATISITGNLVASEDVLGFVNNNAAMGDIEGSYLSGSNALQLFSFGGSATKAQFQAALRAVTYLNTSDAPNTNARTIGVHVQSGPQVSSVATRTMTITAANDTPQFANLEGDSVAFLEAGPAATLDVFSNALVIDPDPEPFALGVLEFGMTNNVSTNDMFVLDLAGSVQLPQGMTSGAPVVVSGTDIGLFTTPGGPGMHLIIELNSNATPALVQTLVRAVAFTNSSATPSSATRAIRARLVDAGGRVAEAGLSAVVASVNNAPTITPPADFSITEHEYFSIPAFTVADVDAETNELLVTLELSAGFLSTTVLPFPGVVAAGTNGLSRLRGTATAINEFLARETNFLAVVSEDGITNVTLTIGVSDGGHVGAGGLGTNHSVVQLALTPVNDEPPLLGWYENGIIFLEGGTPVFLDDGLDGTVTDPDSTDFAEGFLNVSFMTGGQPSEDVLAFATNGAVALSAAFTAGSSVSVSNVSVGTLDSTGSGEALRVTFNTNATPARVQALARTLTYKNTSESPTEAIRSVLLRISDGDGGTNSAGVSLTVVDVNDAPRFNLTVGYGQSNSTQIVAWGNNGLGETNVPPGLGRVAAISAGHDHSLALLADGTVVAWGENAHGQTNVPPGLTNVAAVSAGLFFSTALLSNGTVVAWGQNTYGQTNVPAGLSNAVRIAAGPQRSLAVRGNGEIVTWTSANWPPSNLSIVHSADFGVLHAVVLLLDGTVQCYGDNAFGQLNVPSGVSNIVAVAAGWYHSVALHHDGRVSAWGHNGNLQSTPPEDLTNAIAIGAPGFGGLAVRADGSLVSWGNTLTFANTPALEGVLAVSGGSFHALAIVPVLLDGVTVAEDSGPFTRSGAATNISVGPAGEAAQSITFLVTAADTNMFSVQPAISTNGTLTFTPAPNAYGTTTVSVVAMDNGGTAYGGDDTSDAQTFTLMIESVADAPVAEPDAYSVAEDATLTVVAVTGVLTNDSGGDGDSLTASLVTDVAHGALTLAANGSFSYTPATNYFGTDSFQYQITNNSGTSVVETVTLTVTPVNDAPEVGVTSAGSIPGVGQALIGIAVLDADAGTNLISVEIVASAGTLSAISYGGISPETNALNPNLVRLVGSATNLTAYLDYGAVLLRIPDDVTTNFTYTVTVDDHGHTGADPGTSGTTTNEIASSTAPVWISPIMRRLNGPDPGHYGLGMSLDFTLQSSERLILINTNAGVPGITLHLWATNRTATYVSGSGTTNLLFRYTVQPGDWAQTVTPDPLLAYGGSSIVDLEGNAFIGNISGAALDGVIVDAVPPQSVGLSPIAPAWYPLGAVVTFNLLFGKDIIVNTNGGVPYLALTLQNTNALATYVSGSGSSMLTFQYTVREGDLATNGMILSNNIVFGGATLRDAAGNDAVPGFAPGDLSLAGVRVDGVPPTFDYAIHYSPTPDFNIGSTIRFEAYASEPVTVDTNFGLIQIEYQFDFGAAFGDYASNRADGLRLYFVHTVEPGDQATNGFSWSTNLIFNPLAITDVAGNSPRPALPPPYRYDNVIVDSLMPAITNAILPPDGIYTSSQPMDLIFEYSEAVTNLGTPRFALTVNGATRFLNYHSGSGSSALVFRYTPQTGDFDTNGISISGTLDLNGGAIRDLSGNDAEPVDIGENTFPALRVDASRPVAGNDTYGFLEDGGTHGFDVIFNDSDADTNALTFTLVSGATNGTVSPGPDDRFLYTPNTNFAGIDAFTYVVSDGLLTSAVATVTIEILAVNDPPTVTGPSRITVTNGVPRPVLGVSVADVDSGTNTVLLTLIAGDLGSVFLATNRSGVTVSNGGSGVHTFLRGSVSNLNAYLAATNIFYIADTNREAHQALAVYIHDEGHDGDDPGLDGDPDGESAMIAILVDNGAVNEPPIVNPALMNQAATYGTALTFTFATNAFTDPDGDALGYTASGLPPGITFTGSTRTFAGTPTTVGSYTVRVIAGDGRTPELRATNSFTIAVAKAVLIITADDQSRACGTSNPELTLSFAGFRGSDTRTVLDTLPVIFTEANAVSSPGVYPIRLTGGSDGNYELTLVGGTLVVTNSGPGTGTVRGTYHGLFYETNEVRYESSGAFLFKATDAGAYSGTLELAGSKLRLSGIFPTGRAMTNVIARKNLSSLTVVLGFDDCDPPQAIFGTVSDGSWTAPLMATPLHFHAKTNPAPAAGRYTMTIPGFESDATLPAGHGWGTVSVTTAGKLKLAGTLADGTKLTDGSTLNEAGLWPFYLPYARIGGAMLGWITFDSGGTNFGGTLAWIRKTQPATAKLYAAGFTNETLAIGSRYIAPGRGTNVFTWTNGVALAEGGNLSGVLSNQFNIGPANRVTWLGTNFTALNFTAKDGRFKGTLRNDGTGKPATFNGVIHPEFGIGAGFFLGTNQSGLISIEPAP